MRWTAVVLFGYVFVGLDLGLKPALAMGPPTRNIAPGFLMPFCVFIAVFAPAVPALWTALAFGAVVDLATAWAPTGLVILGPNALGYMAAAYLVLTMRGVMIRRNPLSIMLLSILGMTMAQIVVVAFMTIRSWSDHTLEWHAVDQLLHRLLCSLYTGLTGLLVGLVMVPLSTLFSFPDSQGRRFGRR